MYGVAKIIRIEHATYQVKSMNYLKEMRL